MIVHPDVALLTIAEAEHLLEIDRLRIERLTHTRLLRYKGLAFLKEPWGDQIHGFISGIVQIKSHDDPSLLKHCFSRAGADLASLDLTNFLANSELSLHFRYYVNGRVRDSENYEIESIDGDFSGPIFLSLRELELLNGRYQFVPGSLTQHLLNVGWFDEADIENSEYHLAHGYGFVEINPLGSAVEGAETLPPEPPLMQSQPMAMAISNSPSDALAAEPSANEEEFSGVKAERVLRTIGLLAHVLAKRGPSLLRKGGEPNITQIWQYLDEELQALGVPDTAQKRSHVSNLIQRGLEQIKKDRSA